MTPVALALVLCGALAHASWNLVLKKSPGGGIAFFWLVGCAETVLYAPLAIGQMALADYTPDLVALGMILGSGLMHVAYFWLLDRGYRTGDLSVVYPLARATGPLLTMAAAIVLLGDRPGAMALAGAGLILAGALALGGNPLRLFSRGGRPKGLGFALACGASIAVYTVWDRQAVAHFLIPAILFYWGTLVARVIVTAPHAWTERAKVAGIWRADRKSVLLVAVLSPLSYTLALFAMKLAPLSLVAPARETSILFATLMGTKLLAEGRDDGQNRRRLLCAGGMTVGLGLLALG